MTHSQKTIDLFCKVIDNFGDAGVSWRLCQQLAQEGWHVRLWIDDLPCLHHLVQALDILLTKQTLETIEIISWTDTTALPDELPQAVIEMFACDAPLAYHQWIQASDIFIPWVIVEYLSAEDWVASFHLQSSRHSTGIEKTYFFPGFTTNTGGLFYEPQLEHRRDVFLSQNPNWLQERFAIPNVALEHRISTSLFCYAHAPYPLLQHHPLLLLVPQGILPQLNDGVWGNAYIHRIPFLSSSEYDQLLWSCDLNFVRGEDSFLRAHWAGKPFVWQIYPQEEDAHVPKLEAWLQTTNMNSEIKKWHYEWNQISGNTPNSNILTLHDTAVIWQQWQQSSDTLTKSLFLNPCFVSNLCAWLKNKVE